MGEVKLGGKSWNRVPYDVGPLRIPTSLHVLSNDRKHVSYASSKVKGYSILLACKLQQKVIRGADKPLSWFRLHKECSASLMGAWIADKFNVQFRRSRSLQVSSPHYMGAIIFIYFLEKKMLGWFSSEEISFRKSCFDKETTNFLVGITNRNIFLRDWI